MSTKGSVVKGRGAWLIPLVDELDMALNNGPHLFHVAPFGGLNSLVELTHCYLHVNNAKVYRRGQIV